MRSNWYIYETKLNNVSVTLLIQLVDFNKFIGLFFSFFFCFFVQQSFNDREQLNCNLISLGTADHLNFMRYVYNAGSKQFVCSS